MHQFEDSDEIETLKSREKMLQRGKFTANGYVFTVKPLLLGEEDEYLEDVKVALYPRAEGKKPEDFTDKELSQYAIWLFSQRNEVALPKKQGLLDKLKLRLVKTFCKNYQYYSDNPKAMGIIKWVEKKIYYKNKRIKFYDLERKYGLSKSEIIKMLGYFEELSGF